MHTTQGLESQRLSRRSCGLGPSRIPPSALPISHLSMAKDAGSVAHHHRAAEKHFAHLTYLTLSNKTSGTLSLQSPPTPTPPHPGHGFEPTLPFISVLSVAAPVGRSLIYCSLGGAVCFGATKSLKQCLPSSCIAWLPLEREPNCHPSPVLLSGRGVSK